MQLIMESDTIDIKTKGMEVAENFVQNRLANGRKEDINIEINDKPEMEIVSDLQKELEQNVTNGDSESVEESKLNLQKELEQNAEESKLENGVIDTVTEVDKIETSEVVTQNREDDSVDGNETVHSTTEENYTSQNESIGNDKIDDDKVIDLIESGKTDDPASSEIINISENENDAQVTDLNTDEITNDCQDTEVTENCLETEKSTVDLNSSNEEHEKNQGDTQGGDKAEVESCIDNIETDLISFVDTEESDSNKKTVDVTETIDEINVDDKVAETTKKTCTDGDRTDTSSIIDSTDNSETPNKPKIIDAGRASLEGILRLNESSDDEDIICQDFQNESVNEDEKVSTQSQVPLCSNEMDVDIDTTIKSAEPSKDLQEIKKNEPNRNKSICGLSNTLDILSDDDETEEQDVIKNKNDVTPEVEKSEKCSNEDDDDDVMLVDEEISNKNIVDKKETVTNNDESNTDHKLDNTVPDEKIDSIDNNSNDDKDKQLSKISEPISKAEEMDVENLEINEKKANLSPKPEITKPVVPANFLKTFKTNVADMSRDELEEFCLLKIVEGVIDRSNLSELKAKLKTLSKNMEEWKQKSMLLTKQNRDLQIVLKAVQEAQKQRTDNPITPLKITRSVGMQVIMTDYERNNKQKGSQQNQPSNNNNRVNRNSTTPTQKASKPQTSSPQIPVPRLVPAPSSNNSPSKITKQPPQTQIQNSTVSSNSGKPQATTPNGAKNTPPKPEKRPFSQVQSVTVDLTDDEPPSKQLAMQRNNPQQGIRLVAQQQLLTPRAQITQNMAGPRKVYIPINSQTQNVRPGQTIMLKTVASMNPRPRAPAPMVRIPNNAGPLRVPRNITQRHPAPLPDIPRQPHSPKWKPMPPAPDLKISKVENGIVISWKIEGYHEDNFEEIASYQLYAYHETATPPGTSLWKKIGDVKALPLPMACTLTQFMAGNKYYFAVRAVDVRSRIGPFSLPGSILLLNK